MVLVGRKRELELSNGFLDDAAAGRGGLRLIHGDPGIGKTELAEQIAARGAQRGFVVAWGRAWETGGAPAYWPWIEALNQVRGALGTLDSPPAPLLRLLDRDAVERASSGTVERTRADPSRERFELFDAVGTWLQSAMRVTPILLVFDDLHAADVPSLELLGFLAPRLRTTRVAIVGTFRSSEAQLPVIADVIARIARSGTAIPLGPLSMEAVSIWVENELGALDAELVASLRELTEGNPLFLRETLDALATGARARANQPAVSLAELRRIALAGGVMALCRERLRGASDESRSGLFTAAVLGRSVELGIFVEVTGLGVDASRRVLEEGVARGLLRRADGGWVFAHVLVRESLYEELDERERREFHAKVRRALERRVEQGQSELASALAHHALAALPTERSGDVELATQSARIAAERARRQLAYEEAIALLDRARVAAETFGAAEVERAELLLALGWACTEAGQIARGRELFRQVAALARRIGDARLLSRAALGQGGQYVLAEIRDELVSVLREALAALATPATETELRLRARLLARLAAALTPSLTPAEPLVLAREALTITSQESDARTRMDVDVAVGAALTDFAAPGERIPVNERLVRDARAASDRVLELRGLTRLACDHLENGELGSADAAIAARGALADAIGIARYRWQSPLLASMRAMAFGRWDICDAAFAEVLTLLRDNAGAEAAFDPNADRCLAFHRFFMLLVAGRPGELRSYEAEFQRAMTLLPDGAQYRPWAVATVLARNGDPEAARRSLYENGHHERPSARGFRVSTADTALLCGASDWYEPLYRSLLPDEGANSGFGPIGFTCGPPIGRILGGLAFALGRAEAAERHLKGALALSERMGASAHLAWIHLTWGEGLRGRDAGRARAELELALQRGKELGMREVVERAQRASDALSSTRVASAPPSPSAGSAAFALARLGDAWRVTRGERCFTVKDVRGMGMLEKLVVNAGRELHALELAAGPEDRAANAAIDLGDAGEVLDAKARAAYKARIADLEDQLAEAEGFGDLQRRHKLECELEALTQQIAAAVGLGGRERRSGSAAERARITVARRVREAIKKIAEQDPELGRHLTVAIRTGTYSAYEPDRVPTRR